MNRSVAFTAVPFFLLAGALAACSSGSSGSSSPPSTVSTTTSLAVGECADETAPASSNGTVDDKMTADGSCRARGLALGSFDDAAGTASYSCCKMPPTPIETDGGVVLPDGGYPPPGECETDSLGSPTSSADPATWKDDAAKTCELRGETLSDFSVADPTSDGDYRFAKITCCEVAPPPIVCNCPVEPVVYPGVPTTGGGILPTPIGIDGGVAPVPDAGVSPVCTCTTPPPPVCNGGGFGNAKGTCTSSADAYQQAANDCAEEGLALTDFQSFQGTCPSGSVESASFECCATATPPPPACESTGFGNAKGTCTALADAQKSASADCTSQGKILEDFTTDQGSCPDGSISSGSYSCCGSEVIGTPIEIDAGAPVPTPAPKVPVSN